MRGTKNQLVGRYHLLMTLMISMWVSACGNLSPFQSDPDLRSSELPAHPELTELPAPSEKMVAAVYRFRDQTGQYKPSEDVASWSTAVTQGATSILLKTIQDSGWFNAIEREGISNLMNERQIIRSIRAEHGDQGPLPPLLYAGVMLEGGIIGYDSNTMTGGMGARYLGIGGSSEFRQDKVTIYLRAVSTQNSRILKTVHTTETILSQKVDANVFKFVDESKILEGEAGYTVNEPATMAVTRAIEKAVEKLIMEGIKDGLWSVAEEDQPHLEEYIDRYDQRISARNDIDYFGRQLKERRGRIGFGMNLDGQKYQGNYSDPLMRPSLNLNSYLRISPRLYGNLNVHRGNIAAKRQFETTYTGAQASLKGVVFPELTLSPFVKLGGGVMVSEDDPFRFEYDWDQMHPYVGGALGLEYMITDRVGLNLAMNTRYSLKDGLDDVQMGRVNDFIWSIGGGISLYAW